MLSFTWQINDDDEKQKQTTTAAENSSTFSEPKKHIIRRKKILVHERIKLYKTRGSDDSERTLPNSGYVSQTACAFFKTIYKGFPLWPTCIVVQPVLSVLWFDVHKLINYQNVLHPVNIFLSRRVWHEIRKLWHCHDHVK